jgi:hypothetical protein
MGYLSCHKPHSLLEGTIEETSDSSLVYAVAGNGLSAIMIHGTGGGFDQGIAFPSQLIVVGYESFSLVFCFDLSQCWGDNDVS